MITNVKELLEKIAKQKRLYGCWERDGKCTPTQAEYSQLALEWVEKLIKDNDFSPSVLGSVDVKVLPTNFKETEFCLSDYDDIPIITNYVNDGTLKMGDKVKVIFIKCNDR